MREEGIGIVCEQFDTAAGDLRRRRQVSDARLAVMKLVKEEAGFTQREVAAELGLRDGSGVSRAPR